MQCANLLRKRSVQKEEEPWSCTPKRRCLEAELLVVDCPMEASLGPAGTTEQQQKQQQQQQVGVIQSRPAALCCPRCLGGEPGHINHIMGH